MNDTETNAFGVPTGILPGKQAMAREDFRAGARGRRPFPLWAKCAAAVFACLIVLAIVWTRYQLNWIRERHEFLVAAAIDLRKGRISIVMGDVQFIDHGSQTPTIKAPWSLRLFGEPGVRSLWAEASKTRWRGDPLWNADEKWSAKAQSLFPEARVMISHPDGRNRF